MNELIKPFFDELEVLNLIIANSKTIRIGTLGPDGTTSYFALEHLLKNDIFKNKKINIHLWDNFKSVHKNLLDGKIDLMLVPNAYEEITSMYWDSNLKNVMSFVLHTPAYGMVVVNENNRKDNIKISVCSPVKCLVDSFCNELSISRYSIVLAKSTVDAARMLVENTVDYAITNAITSKAMNLKFVTKCFSAEVVWTVFARRSFYEKFGKETTC